MAYYSSYNTPMLYYSYPTVYPWMTGKIKWKYVSKNRILNFDDILDGSYQNYFYAVDGTSSNKFSGGKIIGKIILGILKIGLRVGLNSIGGGGFDDFINIGGDVALDFGA